MNAKQAQQEMQKTIISLARSGVIYRSDNLALLDTLSTEQKKAFYAVRNNLSKLAIAGKLKTSEIVRAFSSVLPKSRV
jgi:hypothetical protein